MKQHPGMKQAFKEAMQFEGLAEIPGAAHEETIVEMFKTVGHGWVKDDETAWCAAFAGAMLERSGLQSTRKLNARSYLDIGEPVDLEDAWPGDLVIFWRGSRNGWQGHVGFYVSHGASKISVLGGNQSDKVSVAPYDRSRLLGVRRIPAPPSTQFNLIEFITNLFRRILAK